MIKILSGIKDVDLKIISELNDYELGKVCLVNKYVNSLCNDENFWRNRTINLFITSEKVFQNLRELDIYRNNMKWKDFYKYLMSYVNKYIKGDYTSSTKRPLRYLDDIAYTFHKNGGIMLSLLSEKKYKKLDYFLDNHPLISPANEYIYSNVDTEQFSYLVNRFRNGDLRFNLYNPKIIQAILESDNDNYEVLMDHIGPDLILKTMLEKRAYNISEEKISNILYSPFITLNGLMQLKFDSYVPEEIAIQIINLRKSLSQ